MILEWPLLKPCSISIVCGHRYIFLWWNILHWAGVLQHQRPLVWADGSASLLTGSSISKAESYTCWCFLANAIITSDQIPEDFNVDYICEVMTEHFKSTICLICELCCSMATTGELLSEQTTFHYKNDMFQCCSSRLTVNYASCIDDEVMSSTYSFISLSHSLASVPFLLIGQSLHGRGYWKDWKK